MQIFALDASKSLGDRIAEHLEINLSPHEERDFADGEHKFRPLVSVKGNDVYVVLSLFGEPENSVNDRLIKLLFFLGALRDAGADRITAVVPYLAYSRKDRRTKPRDPLSTRYVAQLFEAMGVNLVVTIDVHNIAAFQNAFRCRVEHIDTRRKFAAHLAKRLGEEPVAVASPDPGGVKRAQLFRETLEKKIGRPVGFAFMEKRRSAEVVSGNLIGGDVADAAVIIVDDLISSGGTMARAARAFRDAGARKIYAVATHGLFVGDAASALQSPDIKKMIITDTVEPFRLQQSLIEKHIEVISIAPLIAETIRRLHNEESITDLLERTD